MEPDIQNVETFVQNSILLNNSSLSDCDILKFNHNQPS